MGETLEIVARDVSLEITARDDIRIEPISPYPATSRATGRTVALGDLGSEQVVEVVLRLSFPYGDLGRETGAIVALTDRDGVFGPAGRCGTEPSGWPGPTPTTAPTTPSRATARWTGRWPGCSRRALDRRRSAEPGGDYAGARRA